MNKQDNGSATTTAKITDASKAKGNGASKTAKKADIIAPAKKAPILTPEQALQSKLDQIQKKYELIAIRNRFLETKAQLNSYTSEQGNQFDSTLDHNNLKIVLQDDRNYNEAPISISNSGLVRDICEFLKSRVDQKLLQIETQLLT